MQRLVPDRVHRRQQFPASSRPTRVVLVSDDRFRTQIGEECPGLDTHIRGHDRNTYQAVGDVVTKLGLRTVGVEASGVTLEAFEKLQGECKSATLGGSTGLWKSSAR